MKKAALILGMLTACCVGAWFFLIPDDLVENAKGASGPAVNQPEGSNVPRPAAALVRDDLKFVNVTADSGVDFEFKGPPTEKAYMIEQNGGGVGLFDFDNDGALDCFFVNGARPGRPDSELTSSNRLYRGDSDFRFGDVTRASGLKAHGHGQGCAAADFDNDGFIDLFVTSFGRDRLWRNNGDGTFTDVTKTAGVGGKLWGTSAAFADLNADGLTDLYVVNYVDWSPDDPACHPPGRDDVNFVCSPLDRAGQVDYLYQNMGDGSFKEVAKSSGVGIEETGKGLALAVTDLTGDGWFDVYVANDTSPNFLFENRRGMKFEETAVLQGASISSDGSVGAGMGVACADYDGNGWFDLAVTNFRGQPNDVFSNLGEASFVPANDTLGMDLISRAKLSFGIVFCDFNLDARPELFVANGHIHDWSFSDVSSEYHMNPQVLLNEGGRRFVDISSGSGDYFEQKWLGRAVAIGDLDNDGDCDVVVTHADAPPVLLRNDSARPEAGVALRLIGTISARSALGSTVRVTADGRTLTTRVRSGTGFQAAHDSRVVVPRPTDGKAYEAIEVVWAGGMTERWSSVPVSGEVITLIQGSGQIHQAEGVK